MGFTPSHIPGPEFQVFVLCSVSERSERRVVESGNVITIWSLNNTTTISSPWRSVIGPLEYRISHYISVE